MAKSNAQITAAKRNLEKARRAKKATSGTGIVTTKSTVYWRARAGASPLSQARSFIAGQRRYGTPIQMKGRKGTSYDRKTRTAKRRG